MFSFVAAGSCDSRFSFWSWHSRVTFDPYTPGTSGAHSVVSFPSSFTFFSWQPRVSIITFEALWSYNSRLAFRSWISRFTFQPFACSPSFTCTILTPVTFGSWQPSITFRTVKPIESSFTFISTGSLRTRFAFWSRHWRVTITRGHTSACTTFALHSFLSSQAWFTWATLLAIQPIWSW